MTPPKSKIIIADSGSTSHYFMNNNSCINTKIDENPISVRLPNNTSIKSTHMAELPIENVSIEAKKVRIFKDL